MGLNDLCTLDQFFWHACHGLYWVNQSKKYDLQHLTISILLVIAFILHVNYNMFA